MKFFRAAVCVTVGMIASAMAVGCSSGPKRGETAGKVTYQGKPVTSGRVSFQATDAAGFSDIAKLGADGSYVVQNETGKGLPVGEYKVSLLPPIQEGDVMATKPIAKEAFAVPGKFQNPDTSGLKITVKEGANEAFNFDLK